MLLRCSKFYPSQFFLSLTSGRQTDCATVAGSEQEHRMTATGIAPNRDRLTQLLKRAVEKPGIGFAIVFGTSQMPVERLSLHEAREILGYEPQDSWADYFEVKA